MRFRTLAAAAGLTLALGLALPETARADRRSCGRSYGRSSYGYTSYRYAPSYRPYVSYAPVYDPYVYSPYSYDPYYSYSYRPGYYARRPVPLVVYRRVPYRRPHLNISIGF